MDGETQPVGSVPFRFGGRFVLRFDDHRGTARCGNQHVGMAARVVGEGLGILGAHLAARQHAAEQVSQGIVGVGFSLTDSADEFLKESRTGKNILHQLIPLLRQSVYSRLAGYDDTNDADRLSQDPALRVVVGWKGPDRNAASTSEMGRFETELLTQKERELYTILILS